MTPKQFYEALAVHMRLFIPDHIPIGFNEAPDKSPDYVVIWPTPGTPVDDRSANNRMGSEATDLVFQVTAVTDNPMNLLQLMQDVNIALTEASVSGHLIRPDVITNRAVTPLRDETRQPVRHYMATTWQTTLTRQKEVAHGDS